MWHPLSESFLKTVKSYLPAELWTVISPELYVLFWSLSYHDVFVPTKRYEIETKRLRERYATIDSLYKGSSVSSASGAVLTGQELEKAKKQQVPAYAYHSIHMSPLTS